MKKLIAILLTVMMLVPMLTVFFTVGASAAGQVYDKPILNDAGMTFASETLTKTAEQSYTSKAISMKYGLEIYKTKKKLTEVPHTFQVWVKVSATDTGVVLGNLRSTNNTAGSFFNLEIKSGCIPYIRHNDEFAAAYELEFKDSVITPNTWTMLTVVWDGESGRVSCYLNGELQQEMYYLPDIDPHALAYPFAIGGDHRPMNRNPFTGALQDVSMYATARTAEQVKADYQQGVNTADADLLCHYDISSADKGKDVADEAGDYDMLYDKTWLDEDEMNAIRKQNGMLKADGTPNYAYSFVAIGDTQKTTEYEAVTLNNNYGKTIYSSPTTENSLLYRMYNKIVQEKDAKNTELVMGLGDITDNNFDREWQLAYRSIGQLDGNVPYTVVRGNHDNYNNGGKTYQDFEKYFASTTYVQYVNQFPNTTKSASAYTSSTGGRYAADSVRNTYLKITTESGAKWMVLTLDWACSNDVLTWAGAVCAANPDYSVIITTHAYLGSDAAPLQHGDLSESPNNGDDKWNKLASQYANVKMVLSGHIGSDELPTSQVKGVKGNVVTQMLIDPQDADELMHGLGVITTFYFKADGSGCYVEHYSVGMQRYFHTTNQFYLDLNPQDAEVQDLTAPDLVEGQQPAGSGTAASPYLISNRYHLAWMAYRVEKSDHLVMFQGVHFKQTCDIDLQGDLMQSIGGYFKNATGDASALNAKAFGGVYDGGGYVIRNGVIVPCNPDSSLNKRKQFGLFGCIYGATIQNVTVEDMQIIGRGPTGAIVGKAMAPWDGSADVGFNQIIGCHVGADVEIRTWHPKPVYNAEYDSVYKMAVGGVCGIAYATTIRGCTAANTITVGGVFGAMLGGIAGTAGYNTVIDRCAFTGGIELVDTHFAASVSVGGITGCMSPHLGTVVDMDVGSEAMVGILHITNCYSSGYYAYTGTVSVDVVNKDLGYNINGKNIHWGGIIGHAGSMPEITPTDAVPYPYLIENCYNLYSEQRSVLEQNHIRYVTGGIVGRSTANRAVSNAFWLKDCYSVKVDADGLNKATSTNEYRCDATGLTSEGLPAVQVVLDDDGSRTVGTKTLAQMRADVLSLNAEIVRIQQNEEDATMWRFGAGVPTEAVTVGDLYLDTATSNVYVYVGRPVGNVYTDAPWASLCSIKGQDGNKWHTGTEVPTADDVAVGDLFLNTETGDVFRYTGVIWKPVGNLTGPQGEDGEKGEKGEPGADAAVSEDANAGGVSNSTSTGKGSTEGTQKKDSTATVALILAGVMAVINLVFIVCYFVGKKRNA